MTKPRKQYHIKATVYDKRGRVLSTASNSYTKTHPLQAYYGALTGKPEATYLHAEIAAMIRCREPDRMYRIVIERYDHKGDPILAAPCPACTAAIDDTGIVVVEHT